MRKIVTFSLISLATIVALSGCSFQEETTPGSANVVSVKNTNGMSHYDVMFIEDMIEHHKQAIEMSQMALTNTKNGDILTIANNIIKAQTEEISLLESWSAKNKDMHMDAKMDSMGMMSETELAELKNAKDEKFDKLYLMGMIVHHEGAVEMAKNVLGSSNVDLVDFATKVIAAQTSEIEQMKSLL